jgi:branched-chain amino acid transport system ATP-binding protein
MSGEPSAPRPPPVARDPRTLQANERTLLAWLRTGVSLITFGFAIAQLGIAYVPENMGIFADLTVRENMLLAARQAKSAAELDGTRLEWLFALFPALRKFWLYPAGKLSGGQQQMLAIARAMVEPRRLLLIDEPSKGLAPAIVQNLIAALRELKSTATTVLLVEQNFAMAKALGDTVAVMDDGRVVHRGDMATLAADEALQHKLLGLSLATHQ